MFSIGKVEFAPFCCEIFLQVTSLNPWLRIPDLCFECALLPLSSLLFCESTSLCNVGRLQWLLESAFEGIQPISSASFCSSLICQWARLEKPATERKAPITQTVSTLPSRCTLCFWCSMYGQSGITRTWLRVSVIKAQLSFGCLKEWTCTVILKSRKLLEVKAIVRKWVSEIDFLRQKED